MLTHKLRWGGLLPLVLVLNTACQPLLSNATVSTSGLVTGAALRSAPQSQATPWSSVGPTAVTNLPALAAPAPSATPVTNLPALVSPAPSATPVTNLPALVAPAPSATPVTNLPALAAPLPNATYLPFVANMTAIRAFRVDFNNYETSRAEIPTLEANMKSAGINLVALGAGRVEWNYFKWAGHDATWSNDVKDTGIDFLAEDAARFKPWAQVNAVIDVLGPNYIKAHPQAAAVSFTGQTSTDFVSTSELVYGDYGKQLLAMVDYIAANYPVDSISLTELFYYSDGYGADDKASYLAYSGNTDWPRDSSGVIDRNNDSIGAWRTHMLDVFVDQAVAIAHSHGKKLYLDVKISLNNLANCSNECGTNYHVVLIHTDRIIVWAYYDLDNYAPEYLTTVSQFLSSFGNDRVILSVGLWDDVYPQTPPDMLRRAILATQAGGINNLWITPNILMTPQHWQVLKDLWGPKS
jgi:hypothetical protein